MRPRGSHLLAMLLVAGAVFTVGAVQKAPCANRAWVEHREGGYAHCYSDVTDLYEWEQLAGGRLALPRCVHARDPSLRRIPGAVDVRDARVGLAGRQRRRRLRRLLLGQRPDPVGLCPRHGLVPRNARRAHDLVRRCPDVARLRSDELGPRVRSARYPRDAAVPARAAARRTGVALGLGAAAKVYPALLLLPFGLDDLRGRSIRPIVRMAMWFAITWLLVDLPFMLAARGPWFTTYRFNATRPPEHDSLWRAVTFDRLDREHARRQPPVVRDPAGGDPVDLAHQGAQGAGVPALDARLPVPRDVPARRTRSGRRSTPCGCCPGSR